MYAYKCVTAYQGTRYNGWQRQGNTDRTIQGKLEAVLSELLGEPVEIMGSGRTDAGVHALGQVFHFHCRRDLRGMSEDGSSDPLAGSRSVRTVWIARMTIGVASALLPVASLPLQYF